MATPTEPERLLRFVRASRSDGDPHQVVIRDFDLRPLSCSCRAGQYGRLCHAVIDVAARELLPLARERWLQACGMDEVKAAARVLSQVNKWQKAAAELAALRSCGYVPVKPGPEEIVA